MRLGTANRRPLMGRIRFIPAQVKTFPDEMPDARKRRGSPTLARRETADKSVIDLRAAGAVAPLPRRRGAPANLVTFG